MKKFQFAAGLLAAGLLASCSSDAPDMPNGGNATPGSDEEVVATLAVRIAPSVTRASGDTENGTDVESKINGVRVYVVRDDEARTRVFTGYTNTLESGTAKIAITKDRYDVLTTEKEAGTPYQYRVYVVCNANENVTSLTADQEIDGTTDGVSKIATDNNFTMTNASAEPVTLIKETSGETTILKVPDVIKVDRLAVRYDYTAPAIMNIAGKEEDVAKDFNDNNSIKLEVVGATLENLNLKDYLFPHRGGVAFGTTGYWNTPNFTMPGVKPFSEYTYSGITKYGFACGYPGDTTTPFKDFTYAAFKVKMDLSESKFNGMTGNLYAYNHILLGDEQALKDQTFDTGNEDTNKAIIQMVESLSLREGTSGFNFSEEWSKMSGYDVYSQAEDGNYYTYYARNIKTGTDLQIIRNHVYKLSIKSFAKLGVPGDMTPEQQEEKVESLLFQFAVEVNPWTIEENAWDL